MTSVRDLLQGIRSRDPRAIARAISLVEDGRTGSDAILEALDQEPAEGVLVLGVTGPGGAGKSTLTNRIVEFYRKHGRRIGVIAVDPSSPISGGAILGDRVRMMRHATDPDVVMRSMATRGRIGGLCGAAGAAVRILASSGCNPIVIETVGVGQAEIDIVQLADVTALVLAPGLGDDIQAMKAGLVELADVLVINKSDLPGAEALAMEMEVVARQKGTPVCRTCAAEGRGLDELGTAIAQVDKDMTENGRKVGRRRRMREAEVLDWALEFLRPHLTGKLNELQGALPGDPRAAARALLAQAFNDFSQSNPNHPYR